MAPVDHINEPTEVDVLHGFFDLTGYMRISENLTCLELFALMRDYFDLVGDIVAEGDGWLVKAVGDSGPVACGFVSGLRDVYGSTVNFGAVLPSTGFAMTPQVFRKLEPETRQLFKKHTPPMTYIPVEAPHPPNRIYRGKTTK